MLRHLLRAVFLLALFAGTLGGAAPALAVDTPFTVRYAQTLRGSINAVGNQLLTCPTAAAGCTDARNRVGTSSTLNNNYNMGYVDVDGDASTLNSSTSTLSLPAGATVVWAGLYWGADTALGTGGSAAPDAANRGTVRFKVGTGGYQTVSAASADVLSSTGKATRYRAFANVTSLVPAAGNATYTVADVQTGRGDDRYAGWSMIVAYQDSAQDMHRVSVYDGLGTVDATHTFSTNITPFYTPASGTVATKTGLLAFEGDTGIVGETATFNGTALTDAINGPGNLMNSSMAVDGTLFTAKNPNYGNLQGTDIDVWNKTGFLANHQSSAALAFASNQDLFVPSALWLVSDEGPASNTAGPTVGGVARDGSTLTANAGTWEGTPTITYEYQWQRCDSAGANCVNIPGQTGSTYTLSPADVGSTVRVLVTAVNDAGSSAPVASSATGAITQLPPSNVTVPVVSGVARDDRTLTTTLGGWDGTAPLGYGVQWQRCNSAGASCVDIAGATAWSYTLTGNDIGATIRSEVTATNAAGSATAVSVPTSLVVSAPPANTTLPPVSGVARDGQTLTAGTGAWTGTDPLTYAYQWRRCDSAGANCVDIAGATASTYVLTGADIGHEVRVGVTATNVAGNANASSSPTAVIAAAPPAVTVAPAVSGTAVDGQTLSADRGTWSGTGPVTYEYRWLRCAPDGTGCVPISGATDDEYALTSADVGLGIRVEVTATNVAGSTTGRSPVVAVSAAPPVSTTPPSVSGSNVDGQTLTAAPGSWSGTTPLDLDYQWQRCADDGTACADIAGATGSTYDLTGADIGHAIRVEVTGSNAAGDDTAVSAPTVATRPAPPVNTTEPPAPSGTVVDGGTLTADHGTWTGDLPIVYAYQWQRCADDGTACTDIAGATDQTYSPTGADTGHAIVVEITATNPGGSRTEASAPTTPVAAAPPVNTTDPSVTGTPADGATLTADPGDWTGTSPIDAEYQWQRCDEDGTDCTDIAGATDTTYTAGADDIGHAITVVVTVTNAGGTSSQSAGASTVVVASPPHDTAPPVVSGAIGLGETLTAGHGTWTGTAPVTFEYQWQRCDEDGGHCVAITGATDDTYTLGDDDRGHTVVVVVTATNDAGQDTSMSTPSAVLPAPPANKVAPAISGEQEVGKTLTADHGTWTGTGPLTYEYQWLRCGSDGTDCVVITGAADDSYRLTDEDLGHVITVIVTATNAAGMADADARPTSAVRPLATPAPTPAATAPAARPTPDTFPATPGGGSGSLLGDLGDVPGSFVSATSCQQLAGNAKYRRLKLKGIGTVRVRAYTQGPATKLTPILVTTQISHGKASGVRYTIDGRKLRAGRKSTYKAAITPSLLQRIGMHKLKAMVTGKGKRKRAKPIVLKLKTVSCRTLFTAQRWATTAGAGLRLRIDARTALDRLAFKVPAALLPRQTAKPRTIGFMRVFVAGQSLRKRYALKLAKKGRGTFLLKGAGKPVVRSVRGGLQVSGLPARSAVAELTLYRVTKNDGVTKRKRFRLKASVMRPGARALSLSVRPRAPR